MHGLNKAETVLGHHLLYDCYSETTYISVMETSRNLLCIRVQQQTFIISQTHNEMLKSNSIGLSFGCFK